MPSLRSTFKGTYHAREQQMNRLRAKLVITLAGGVKVVVVTKGGAPLPPSPPPPPTPPHGTPTLCGSVAEHDAIALMCTGPKEVIAAVEFASFGTSALHPGRSTGWWGSRFCFFIC